MRTKLKNKAHGIMLMKGIAISNAPYPFTQKYKDKLKELNDYRINGYLNANESLNLEIKYVSDKIL